MVKNFRPNFDEYFGEEWNYPMQAGVGLSFKGIPNNYKKFLDFLMDFSCNPISSRRILNVLEKGETKFVTVMAMLDFNKIGNGLKLLGVTMKIVPPFEYEDPNSPNESEEVDFAVLSVIKNKEIEYSINEKWQKEFEKRLSDTKESLVNHPNGFGRYV